jgi:hypothetical protein
MIFSIVVAKRDIHLAAYMKAHGAKLTEYKDGKFYFMSEIAESDWRVKHAGSDALRVDQELLVLRRFIV